MGLGAPPIARRMRPASGCADAEVLMGKHWPQGGRGRLVGGGGRPRVAAETVKMQMSAEWGLVKRGRGALVKWCSGAAERYTGGPWKAREGGRGEMTELAGRCWLVLAGVAGWCRWCSRQPPMRSMIDSVTVTTLRPREPLANQRALRLPLSVRAAGAAEQQSRTETFPSQLPHRHRIGVASCTIIQHCHCHVVTTDQAQPWMRPQSRPLPSYCDYCLPH